MEEARRSVINVVQWKLIRTLLKFYKVNLKCNSAPLIMSREIEIEDIRLQRKISFGKIV